MKTLLLYDNLVALNRDRHRRTRLRPSGQRFLFARETNSLLLAASELPLACLDYPCVFIEAGDAHAMIALVGLRDSENLFVDAAGDWERGRYLPAFVRRYPFVLADTQQPGEFTVCIDEGFPGLGETEGDALFEPDGSDSAWLTQAKEFLLDFHQQMEHSRAFARRLAELDLLVERVIEYQLDGERRTLRGLKVVDEQKLRALPPETVQELFAQGQLGWIYAHLLSLNQVSRLALKLAAATPEAPPAGMPAAEAEAPAA